jgi:predicted enzyme related to lactoylglutathione lyase
MHMTNSVVHFEIFASDVERAREFYENVLGWTFESGGPPDFYHIVTGPDTDPGLRLGLLAKRRGPAAQGPLNAFRVTVSVTSVADTMATVVAAGGKLRSPIVDIPNVGKVVEIADTEDNVLCILQYVPGHALASR